MLRTETQSGTFEFKFQSCIGGYKLVEATKECTLINPKMLKILKEHVTEDELKLLKWSKFEHPECKDELYKPDNTLTEYLFLYIRELTLKANGSNSSNV
jgi:hypothetical protein